MDLGLDGPTDKSIPYVVVGNLQLAPFVMVFFEVSAPERF